MLTASISTAIVLTGQSLAGVATITDGEVIQVSNEVASNNTSEVLALAFDKTKLKALYVNSNIACNISFGAGNPALVMTAGCPYVWHSLSQFAVPFANNCAAATVANNNASTNVTVDIVAVIDPS